MKVRIFPYFKILNFRSDDVTFLRNAETAIFDRKRERRHNNISCADDSNDNRDKKNSSRLQRTFRVATIVLLQ